jgi:hypothetical protein
MIKSFKNFVNEKICVPVKVGDTILTGRFKNKKTKVKKISKDEHGMPTINGKKAVTFRLNEELIGHVSNPYDFNSKFEVYKNPTTLEKLSPYCRGFLDKNGNIYVVDNNDDITHYDLAKFLNKSGYPIPTSKKIYLFFDTVVPIIRYDSTNDFYIGEGFTKIFDQDNEFKERDIDTFLNDIQKILNKGKIVNPNYNFNIEAIRDISFF